MTDRKKKTSRTQTHLDIGIRTIHQKDGFGKNPPMEMVLKKDKEWGFGVGLEILMKNVNSMKKT